MSLLDVFCKMFHRYNYFNTNTLLLSIVEDFFLNDPELQDKTPYFFKSHTEKYEDSIRKAVVICKKIKQLQEQGKDGVENYM